MASEQPVPDPPWRSVPRADRPSRPALSREAVVDAALAVLATKGPAGLTMRAVATTLGTAPASLYGYVANKEELIELVVDRVMAEVPIPEPADGEPWQAVVRRFVLAGRDAFGRHPGTAGLTLGRIPLGPNSLVRMEAILAAMRAGGLPPLVCGYAGDLLGLYLGAAVHERESWDASPEHQAAQAAQLTAWFAALPANRFPNLLALAGPMTAGDADERFEWGLDVLIRGMASYGDPA